MSFNSTSGTLKVAFSFSILKTLKLFEESLSLNLKLKLLPWGVFDISVGLNDTPFNNTISPFPNAIFFASKFNKLFKLLIVFKALSLPKLNVSLLMCYHY